MEKFNIVIFSNQFFDHPLKTNKWHVSRRLAQAGHNVVFVDPPTRFQKLKRIKLAKNPLREMSLVRKEDGLNIYTPVNLLNFYPVSFLNTLVHWFVLSRLLNRNKLKTILWVYHFDFPDLPDLVSKLHHDLFIYDVVDEYAAFPEYKNQTTTNKGLVRSIEALDDRLKVSINQKGLKGKAWVLARERWLALKSNLMFASAPALVDKFKAIFIELGKEPSRVHFVPNSGDYLRFKDAKTLIHQIPEDLASIKKPIVLFAGALDSYKVNVNLMINTALACPDVSFVLLGPTKLSDPSEDVLKLDTIPNIYLLGQKPYESMPYYFSGASAFIIPYNLNDYTVGGCFPVKFHDALSAGLPVIVTDLPTFGPFEKVCYIAKTEKEYPDLVKKAILEDSEERVKSRQEVAKNNSWEGKVKRQLELIVESLKISNE